MQKDYDDTIRYYIDKDNVVVDTLSWKTIRIGILACLGVSKRLLAREIQTLEPRFMHLDILESGGMLPSVEVRTIFILKSRLDSSRMDILTSSETRWCLERRQLPFLIWVVCSILEGGFVSLELVI